MQLMLIFWILTFGYCKQKNQVISNLAYYEDPFYSRDLATTIDTLKECVTCISGGTDRYCRDMNSTSSLGEWCAAADVAANCTSSTSVSCSNDATNFPSSTGYNLCSLANTTSWCGINEDGLEIFDDVGSTIIGTLFKQLYLIFFTFFFNVKVYLLN